MREGGRLTQPQIYDHTAEHILLGHLEIAVGGDVKVLGEDNLGADSGGVGAEQGKAFDLADGVTIEDHVGAFEQVAHILKDSVVVGLAVQDIEPFEEVASEIEDDEGHNAEDGHLHTFDVFLGILLVFFVFAHCRVCSGKRVAKILIFCQFSGIIHRYFFISLKGNHKGVFMSLFHRGEDFVGGLVGGLVAGGVFPESVLLIVSEGGDVLDAAVVGFEFHRGGKNLDLEADIFGA